MFWDNLSALCKDHGISISRLCAELGLSNSIATKWKKGSIPNNGTLKKSLTTLMYQSIALLQVRRLIRL